VKWRAISKDLWITIVSPTGDGVANGVGVGLVKFTVAQNTSSQQRSGSMVIAGRIVTITQPGVAPLFPVSGHVIEPSGTPIGAVTITFTRVSGGGDIPGPVETNENGAWSQTGFEPGTVYRATPTKPRRTFQSPFRDFSAASGALDFISAGRPV